MTDSMKYLGFKHELYVFEYFQGVAKRYFCNTLKYLVPSYKCDSCATLITPLIIWRCVIFNPILDAITTRKMIRVYYIIILYCGNIILWFGDAVVSEIDCFPSGGSRARIGQRPVKLKYLTSVQKLMVAVNGWRRETARERNWLGEREWEKKNKSSLALRWHNIMYGEGAGLRSRSV